MNGSFPESEISEDRLLSVFVRVVSPVERVSGKTPKNLRLYRWLILFCPRLPRLPFLLLPNPRLSPDPLLLPLSFPFPGFRPTFPFFLSLGCECQLTHAWFLLTVVPYRYRQQGITARYHERIYISAFGCGLDRGTHNM